MLPAEVPSDPETSFLQTPLGGVHVLDQGAGETLLLLHGTGRSVADWQEGLAERLSGRHRIVAFDYVGHGLSDRDHGLGYGTALWSRQSIAVLDALDIDRVTVIGHSVGGVVAAFLAADNPRRTERAVFIGHGIAMDPARPSLRPNASATGRAREAAEAGHPDGPNPSMPGVGRDTPGWTSR